MTDARFKPWKSIRAGRPAGRLDELVRKAGPQLAVLNEITQAYEYRARQYVLVQANQMRELIGELKTITRQARMVAFNA